MSNSQRLLDMLPPYFANLKQTRHIMNAQGERFDQVDKDVESLLDQGFIHTATWGLEMWEQQYLLPVGSGSVEARRNRIFEAKARARGDLLQMLRLIEPTIEAEWNSWGIGITFKYNDQSVAAFESIVRVINEEKPAHLLFKLIPCKNDALEIETRAFASKLDYKRAGYWIVGETPIEAVGEEKEVMLYVD